jgi:hypothetical protein
LSCFTNTLAKVRTELDEKGSVLPAEQTANA